MCLQAGTPVATIAAMPPEDLPIAQFAFPGPLRDQLVAAILAGSKTTTTGLVADYEHEDEPLPRPGQRKTVVDSDGNPVAVIETVAVRVIRLADVDLAHALGEGEGYASVAEWRAAHERFWHSEQMRQALGDPEFTVDDDTPVVTEAFRLVDSQQSDSPSADRSAWPSWDLRRDGPATDDEDGYFGERVAATYDDSSVDEFQPEAIAAAVDVLAGLARDGRALELGIGTGRIALPLAQRGVPVHGIDLSQAMVARLRAKPGGDAIGVTIGDFSTTTVDGAFSLVYLVFNTIMNLTTQDAQVDCFRNAAAHLEPGGCFVIELRVPDLRRLPPGQDIVPWRVSPAEWVFYSYDVATQAMQGHYADFTNGRATYSTIPFRYVWPAELDLMARLAGMRLRERWAGWRREPYTGESRKHISIWEKPAG